MASPPLVRILRELDYGECLQLLVTVSNGRFVYTNGGMPEVEPVTFVLHDYRVLFRLPAGMGPHGVAVFEADQVDHATGLGWSVTIVDQVARNGDLAAFQTDLVRGAQLRFW